MAIKFKKSKLIAKARKMNFSCDRRAGIQLSHDQSVISAFSSAYLVWKYQIIGFESWPFLGINPAERDL